MTKIFDADDFCDENNDLDLLFQIRAKVPDFKINLFTIPGRCSDGFLNEMRKIEWIRMYPHGWMHETSRECENWTYPESVDYLKKIERYGFEKCFKAPGWQISDGMYQALLEFGYMVADQEYNNQRRPKLLKSYLLDSSDKIHGHIGNLGGINQNSIRNMFRYLVSLEGDFSFIH